MYQINKRVRRTRNDLRHWISKKHKLTFITMGLVIASLFFGLVFSLSHLNNQSDLLYTRQQKLHSLARRLQDTQKQKASTIEQLKVKQATEAQLRADIKSLNKKLEAKVEAERIAQRKKSLATRVINTVTGTRTATAASRAVTGSKGNCGDNMYKRYIYQHESGCDTNRYNSIGCYGIGQSCPASKIAHCGASFACQDAWFSNYASQRYGGWAGAYAFWLSHSWW